MKTKLRFSMIVLMSITTMFVYAEDTDYDVKYGYNYDYKHCDTNKDGVVDYSELKLCDEFAGEFVDVADGDTAEASTMTPPYEGVAMVDSSHLPDEPKAVDSSGDDVAMVDSPYLYDESKTDNYLPEHNELEGVLSEKKDAIISFESNTSVGDCPPGQSCTGYVGTADDYFTATLPGASNVDVLLFTKDDVDKIVQKKIEKRLQECKNHPESCGIKTFSTSVSDLNSVKSQLQNREFKIKGYYLQFGNGAYDWIYVTSDGGYVAKLEEGVDEKGNLRWSWIQKPTDKGFSYINIDQVNNTIYFGNIMLFNSWLPSRGYLQD